MTLKDRDSASLTKDCSGPCLGIGFICLKMDTFFIHYIRYALNSYQIDILGAYYHFQSIQRLENGKLKSEIFEMF